MWCCNWTELSYGLRTRRQGAVVVGLQTCSHSLTVSAMNVTKCGCRQPSPLLLCRRTAALPRHCRVQSQPPDFELQQQSRTKLQSPLIKFGCSKPRGGPFIMDAVRSSCSWVAARSSHVTINPAGIEKLVEHVGGELPQIKWNFEGIHYFDNGPLTAQYMLVLDALNFCFWPDDELEYDHLAAGLAEALREDPTVFDAHRLKNFTGPMLRGLLHWPRPLPLEDERVRLLHEVGTELERSFDGQAVNLVAAAKGSAHALVDLVTKHFPGFRDHAVYKGHQVFLYKRAQIFVADLWGAFKGKGLGEFKDIAYITMFADYVVPAVLRHWGILTCSQALSKTLDSLREIPSGSEEEVELRACTITAVETLRDRFAARSENEVLSIQVDWWLWSIGLPSAVSTVPPYHRTRTIYY